MYLLEVDEFCILHIINRLKKSNSSRIDGISSRFITRNINYFVDPMTFLIICYQAGKFPDILKVVSLYKIRESNTSKFQPSCFFRKLLRNRYIIFLQQLLILKLIKNKQELNENKRKKRK